MAENKTKPFNKDEVQKYINEDSLTLIDIFLIIYFSGYQNRFHSDTT